MKKIIPVSKPLISNKVLPLIESELKKTNFSGTYGESLSNFEKDFAKFCGAKYASAVVNGTCALHLALEALGIKKGDEVLVQSLTNMATAFSVSYTGAIPVPVDVELETCNINWSLIEKKVNIKTKAIIVVHLFGHPVDLDPIVKIAKKYNLYLIEDCAQAHGAKYKGLKIGNFGDISCYSFYANKILATGEGGMVVTSSKKLYKKINELKSLSYGDKSRFMHKSIGFNYRMTNITAAIGVEQLKEVKNIIDIKRKVASSYSRRFSAIKELMLPVEKPYAFSVYWMYHITLIGKLEGKRDSILSELKKLGIETRESFVPLNEQIIYSNLLKKKKHDCPVATYIGKNSFYLPSGPDISDADVTLVANSFLSVINRILN